MAATSNSCQGVFFNRISNRESFSNSTIPEFRKLKKKKSTLENNLKQNCEIYLMAHLSSAGRMFWQPKPSTIWLRNWLFSSYAKRKGIHCIQQEFRVFIKS